MTNYLKALLIPALFLILPISHADTPQYSAKPRLAIITTGGTIAMKDSPKNHTAIPALSGSELILAVPALTNIADIEVISFCNIDSSAMTPEIWKKLVPLVQKTANRNDIHGVVITHGTDTMADTAFFLDLVLRTDKPIVLTGAMRDASSPGADGPANLLSAVTQAASSNAYDWGVTLTMNNFIQSAYYVRKENSMNSQTFTSGMKGYLGTVYDGTVTRINDRTHNVILPLPKRLARIPLIKTYVGDNGDLIRQALSTHPEALVIEAFGAGNVNPQVAAAIETAIAQNTPVVITTSCPDGGAHPEYGSTGGGAAMATKGVILSEQLSGEKARILLSVLLGDSTETEWAIKNRHIESILNSP